MLKETNIELTEEQQFIFLLPDDNNFVFVEKMEFGLIPFYPSFYCGHRYEFNGDEFEKKEYVRVQIDCEFNGYYSEED